MNDSPDTPLADLKPQPVSGSSNRRGFSQRISRWAAGVLALVALVVVGLFLRSCFSKTPPPPAKVDPSMSSLIPDDELKPQLLASLTKDELKPEEKRFPSKKDPAPHEISAATLPPSGSMAIFVSDGSGGVRGGLGVPMGTELNAVIEQSVIAGAGGTPIVAKLLSEFVKDGRVLLPRGSRVFGQTMGSVENQLQLRFSRIVFPNGKDHPFSGITAVDGYLKGKHGQRALSILSGAAIGSTGVFVPGGSGYKDVFARNASQGAMNDVGRDLSYYRNTEGTPVVSVRSHKKIVIMVDRPL